MSLVTAPRTGGSPPTATAAATAPALWRRAVAEAVGTAVLVTAIVGSGIAAMSLTPSDAGLRLAYNAAATAAVLAVLIVVFLPLSGAHFNPAVTLVHWWHTRRQAGSGAAAGIYLLAQLGGGVAGAVIANVMFDLPAVALSTTTRSGSSLWLGEVLATAGLVLVIGACVRTGRTGLLPLAVGGWIGAAIWFTASTSFANPAVTLGRTLTDSATGIAASSVPGFLAAQLAGAVLGAAATVVFWPASQPASISTTRESHDT